MHAKLSGFASETNEEQEWQGTQEEDDEDEDLDASG